MTSGAVNFFLMQLLLIAVVLILHTYIGLHVIRRTLIFSDLALDQLAALGILLCIVVSSDEEAGNLVQLNDPITYIWALGAVTLGSFLLAVIKPKSKNIPREAVIGIIFALSLLACFAITDPVNGGEMLFDGTLKGDLDFVTWGLVKVTVIVYLLLLAFHYIFRKKFITLAENPEALKNTWLWEFLFFLSQGIITILIVPVAGVFLAYVFLMLPAAMATMFKKGWKSALLLGWSLGFVACTLGLFASYNIWDLRLFENWPYSSTLVVFMGVFFLTALLIRCIKPLKTDCPIKETC
jgi:zinc/manganese transport system permease protein